ncbi:MAG: hypothetical protein QM709_15085 [Spongiibacteraceae bacterium]
MAAFVSSCATNFSPNEACSTTAQTYDSRVVQCQFPKAAVTQKLTFRANFSGGHDDTKADIEPFIDDIPLKCDEGSKTNLFGEDGDVSLWCSFSIRDHAKSNGIFTIRVKWSHAEYTNYEMTAAKR